MTDPRDPNLTTSLYADVAPVLTHQGTTRSPQVLGNPCEHREKLKEPFTQPFHSRGPTTLEREAPEVRCGDDGTVCARRAQPYPAPPALPFQQSELHRSDLRPRSLRSSCSAPS